MNADARKRFFQELALNLKYEGLTVKPETEDGLLPIDFDGQHLCHVTGSGGVQYWKEDVAGDVRNGALDRVTDIAKITFKYMSQMETAPQLTASGLTGDFRMLAEFNGVVLAGHPTQLGTQFITWERAQNRTLYQGAYHGPGCGNSCYLIAKRGFAVRSGLIPRGALFTQEHLAEICRCVQETLENSDSIPCASPAHRIRSRSLA